MDHNFTRKIKEWLDTEPDSRDIAAGAMLLLRLNNNRILYNNIMRDPLGKVEFLEHQLQKQYDFRVLDLTHEQVAEMEREASRIADDLRLDVPVTGTGADQVEPDADGHDPETDRLLGKRHDHDSLPDEVKALYLENYSLLQRMRECHLRLRMMTLVDHPCPDSERYPFLKELISLDKRLHANWKAYDSFSPEPAQQLDE